MKRLKHDGNGKACRWCVRCKQHKPPRLFPSKGSTCSNCMSIYNDSGGAPPEELLFSSGFRLACQVEWNNNLHPLDRE